jgi:hypothetical protein
MTERLSPNPESFPWLIRISGVFEGWTEEIMSRLGATPVKKLGQEYHLVRMADPGLLREADEAMFVRWNLPVQHSWPCCPQKMEDFVERAAQALWRKFGAMKPQTVQVGVLHPGAAHPYYKHLAVNLRGRTMQLFPPFDISTQDVEGQNPDAPTLFCMVGKEGLFAGMQSPGDSNGFYPGGTKYVSRNIPGTISRAGAKIAESLHDLLLHRRMAPGAGHWLELGASPGGMTSELLARGYHVTAVDRAPLDARLDRAPDLTFVRAGVADFLAPDGEIYDAMLCDLNGDARDSIRHVMRLSRHLKRDGLVVFTLKMPGIDSVEDAVGLGREVMALADSAGLRLIGRTHGSYNRREFTLFFGK